MSAQYPEAREALEQAIKSIDSDLESTHAAYAAYQSSANREYERIDWLLRKRNGLKVALNSLDSHV